MSFESKFEFIEEQEKYECENERKRILQELLAKKRKTTKRKSDSTVATRARKNNNVKKRRRIGFGLVKSKIEKFA